MSLSGSEFEKIVAPFFRELFKEIGYTNILVRNNGSGFQSGFDIKVEFYDSENKKRKIFIECKYYSTKLEADKIFRKKFELHNSNYDPDGFILLSPKVNPSNPDDTFLSNAKSEERVFGFPSEYLIPDNDVNKLFVLESQLYKKIYGVEPAIEINEPEVRGEFKNIIERLIKRKDEIQSKIPKKKDYKKPDKYISRKLIEVNDIKSNQLFITDAKKSLDILENENKIALLGKGGDGKSVELEYIASYFSDEESKFHPHLIKLKNHTNKPIEDYIKGIEYIPKSELLVLIDGLDEVLPGKIQEVRRQILSFAEDYTMAKIIVSCRNNFYFSDISTQSKESLQESTLKKFNPYELAELGSVEIHFFIKNQLLKESDNFTKEIEDKGFASLLNSPYYLIRLVEELKKKKELPKSKSELFQNIITENIKKDISRYYNGGDRAANEIPMSDVITKFAFFLQYKGVSSCIWKEIHEHFSSKEKELIKHSGYNIFGEDDPNSIWSFNHNLIQEFLVAEFISQKDFKTILSLICFPKTKKIIPKWINTIGLLIEILEDSNPVKDKLIKWLIKNEPQLLMQFELGSLNDNKRLNLFKTVFNNYKSQNRRIPWNIFSYFELTKFSNSSETIEFLLKELKNNSNPINSTRNALELLAWYNIEENHSRLKATSKDLVEKYLKNSDLIYSSLVAYTRCFKLTKSEFDYIIESYGEHESSDLRIEVYGAIHRQSLQDDYIDFVIKYIEEHLSGKRNNDENIITSEYTELVYCLRKVKLYESHEKITDLVKTEFPKIQHSIYFKDIIEDLLDSIANKFPDNSKLIQSVLEIINNNKSHLLTDDFNIFSHFFRNINKASDAFKFLYLKNQEQLNYLTLIFLSKLASGDTIKFFANEFIKEKIDKKVIVDFQYDLDNYNKGLLVDFNKLVNEKEKIELPVYGKSLKSLNEKRKQSLDLCFDKEKYKAEFERFFDELGKDTIDEEDVNKIYTTKFSEDAYPLFVYDKVFYFKKNNLSRKKVLSSIEENWESISINSIIDILKQEDQIHLPEGQREYVKEWCENFSNKVDFRNGIKIDESSFEFGKNENKLCYLIIRLNINDLDTGLYLDMLSFKPVNYSLDQSVFDFVSSVVDDRQLIKKRVISNLKEGISYYEVLSDHIDFCKSNNLKEVTPYLIQYLENRELYNVRDNVLSCYIELEGSMNELKSSIDKITDYFKFTLLTKLIEQSSDKDYYYRIVSKGYADEKNIDTKKNWAELLLILQDIEGVKFYINLIKNDKTIPEGLYHSRINSLKTTKALPLIFDLYELGFSSEIDQGDRFENLKQISISILYSICLHENNFSYCYKRFKFYKLKFKLKKFLRVLKIDDQALKILEHNFENMEQQYWVNKELDISFEDAKRKYEKLRA
ncbi:MAG: hypothetical protein WD048_07630 [Chitinophagales bacterium]